MARILGVLLILAVIAGIVSYSQGWIKFSQEDGKTKIEIDKDKAKEDLKNDLHKAEGAVKNAETKVMETIKPKK